MALLVTSMIFVGAYITFFLTYEIVTTRWIHFFRKFDFLQHNIREINCFFWFKNQKNLSADDNIMVNWDFISYKLECKKIFLNCTSKQFQRVDVSG